MLVKAMKLVFCVFGTLILIGTGYVTASEQVVCNRNFKDKCQDGDAFHTESRTLFLGEAIATYCDLDKQVIVYKPFVGVEKQEFAVDGKDYSAFVCTFKRKNSIYLRLQ